MAPSLERRRETLGQGEAFLIAARAWGDTPLAGAVAYPVAVGSTAGALGAPVEAALAAWLQAFAANLVSVAVRAVPVGQTQGLAVLAELEPILLATAARAAASTLDDLGSCAILSDIAAMRHETLDGRLFIS
jgi:urease accessory protein